MEQINKIPNY